MTAEEIRAFAERELEPFAGMYGQAVYRCAAYLSGGVHLPCVALQSRRAWSELAMRRIEEVQRESAEASLLTRGRARRNYRELVETFVCDGNRVDAANLVRLERSRFAIPAALLAKIPGETSMGWTQFVLTMRDGRRFSFATAYALEFFDMPEGYAGADAVAIEPHVREHAEVFRERPFFTCFVEDWPRP